jgi:aminopeptidase YwaD
MASDRLAEKAESYLHKLCVEIPNRRVGSEGNRAATDFFAQTVSSCGFRTESPSFDCMDWHQEGAQLTTDRTSFEVFVSPYSLGCQVRAPLAVVSTVEELEEADFSGKIVLLRGDIAKEQLMPKDFSFYNPDHHKRIIGLLEAKHPSAIIAATSRDVEMVGSVYPFPLFEDGDFDIPSVYMTEEEGNRLAKYAGNVLSLESRATRLAATGCNVMARKGDDADRRVVLFAHIDAKTGTPGAIDNASGVTILLLLAELLASYSGHLGIEIVALNGEDYFSAPGEEQYLALNAGRFDTIVLGINLDGVGYYKGNGAYSLYECPSDLASSIRTVFSAYDGLVEGEPWYQGDHGLFLMNQIPALAITSELLAELLAEIIHSPKDTSEIVDASRLAQVALALRDLVQDLSQASRS